MRRSEADCRYITAAVITDSDLSLALLFGLLCGAYLKHPDAVFWRVLTDFLQRRRLMRAPESAAAEDPAS